MKNLIGRSTWEKEGTKYLGESMAQWWAGVDADLKQLNQKMDLHLQFFAIPTPRVIPCPANPTEDGGFSNIPYILLKWSGSGISRIIFWMFFLLVSSEAGFWLIVVIWLIVWLSGPRVR